MVCELYPNKAVFLKRNTQKLKKNSLSIESRLKLLSQFVQQVGVSLSLFYLWSFSDP